MPIMLDEPGDIPIPMSDTTRLLIDTASLADSSGTGTSMKTHRAAILVRLDELAREQRALRACYNALAPACRLPGEVLCAIFVGAKNLATEEERESSRPGLKVFVPWLPIVETCRYWRSVALGCTELWTTVEFSPAQPMAVVEYRRRRAGLSDAPLRLRYDAVDPTDREMDWKWSAFRALAAKTERLKSVSITMGGARWTSLHSLLPWRGASLPLLEELYVVDRMGRLGQPGVTSGASLALADIPRLRYLHLSRCGLSWTQIPLGPSITVLYLGRLNEQRPTPAEFWRSLKAMPHLKRLSLLDFLPSWVEESGAAVLEVASLRHIYLQDDLRILVPFLRVYAFPKVVELDVDAWECGTATEDEVRSVFRGIKAVPAANSNSVLDPSDGGSQPTIVLDIVTDNPGAQIMLHLYRQPEKDELAGPWRCPDTSFRFRDIGPRRNLTFGMLVEIAHAELPTLSLVDKLQISSAGRDGPGGGGALHLDQMPLYIFQNMKSLVIQRGRPGDVTAFCALLESASGDDDARSGTVQQRFAALRYIGFEAMVFADDTVEREGGDDDATVVVPGLLRRLAEAVRGLPRIRDLSIARCPGFGRESVQFLHAELPNVKVKYIQGL